jgi:membrane associated rhomboid family serine protease
MIPLRDDVPRQRFPVATVTIIALNVVFFFFEAVLGPGALEDFVIRWGIVPARYTSPDIAQMASLPELVLPFFTSMFLHGGWMHLFGNMWSFWIFGDNVEDRLGRFRFVALYLAGGCAAALFHIYTNPGSEIPTIGASGAIAAVMGAYFRLYPRANVLMAIPPFIFGPYFTVPAIVFLGWWFILQFFNGTLSLLASPEQIGGIAWWAHAGGFVFGALLCSVLKVKNFYRRHHDEEVQYSW